MAKIYYKRIVAGMMQFSEVPGMYQDRTKVYFKERVSDGTITAEDYEKYIGEKF